MTDVEHMVVALGYYAPGITESMTVPPSGGRGSCYEMPRPYLVAYSPSQ